MKLTFDQRILKYKYLPY